MDLTLKSSQKWVTEYVALPRRSQCISTRRHVCAKNPVQRGRRRTNRRLANERWRGTAAVIERLWPNTKRLTSTAHRPLFLWSRLVVRLLRSPLSWKRPQQHNINSLRIHRLRSHQDRTKDPRSLVCFFPAYSSFWLPISVGGWSNRV